MNSDERERDEYFTYVDDLVNEMTEIYDRHSELVLEYNTAMVYLQTRNWRDGYVQWVSKSDSVEGRADGVSSD